MHTVVTGGAGHIGSHLVEALVRRGQNVTVIDDLSTGSAENLIPVRDRIRFECFDVRDCDRTSSTIRQADLVYHLAAAVGVPHVLENPSAAVAVNVDATRSVISACSGQRAKLVFASTSEVYGKPASLPMNEDDELVIGNPTSPRWSYALAKALDEHLVLEAGRAGLPVTVLRYFNSYGPRASLAGDGSVVARFIKQALAGERITVHGSGDQVRCFTHVTDIARATFLAGQCAGLEGLVCNVGSQLPTSIAALANMVAELVGGATSVTRVDPTVVYGSRFDETPRRIPDTTRIESQTGWTPRVGLEEGLASTLDWYDAQSRSAPQSA